MSQLPSACHARRSRVLRGWQAAHAARQRGSGDPWSPDRRPFLARPFDWKSAMAASGRATRAGELEGLEDGARNVALHKVRVVRRFRKGAFSYTVCDANGDRAFVRLEPEHLGVEPGEYVETLEGVNLGDVVDVVGCVWHRKRGTALMATSMCVVSRWAEECPNWGFIVDAAAIAPPGAVLVQCNRSYAARVVARCAHLGRCAVAPPPAGDRCDATAVVVDAPSPSDVCLQVVGDDLLAGHVARVVQLQGRVVCLEDAVDSMWRLIAAAGGPSRVAVRCMCYPPSLLPTWQQGLELRARAGGEAFLQPPAGAVRHVAFLAFVNGAYGYALDRAELRSGTAPTADVPCRAYHKVVEALARAASIGPDFARPFALEGCRAIDLGAAPGGWAAFLAQRGCSRVFAVDPAKLNEDVAALPAVRHMQMKAEHAVPLLRSEQADMITCDMNLPPARAAAIIASLGPAAAEGAFLVFTIKFVKRPARAEEADWACLRDDWILSPPMHLFANTQYERTVVGVRRRREPTSQARLNAVWPAGTAHLLQRSGRASATLCHVASWSRRVVGRPGPAAAIAIAAAMVVVVSCTGGVPCLQRRKP